MSTTAGSYIVPRRARMIASASSSVIAGAIRAIGGQRVVAIDHRQDAGANRNLDALQSVRIAGAIPVLMMRANDRHHRIREVDRRQDVGADIDVQLHRLEFGRRQLAGLVEDALGHGQLAGVMQQRRGLDRLQRLLVEPAERLGQAHRVMLHAMNVAAGDAVLRFDRGRERADRREIQAVDGRDVLLGVFDAAGPRPHREVDDRQSAAAPPASASTLRYCDEQNQQERRRGRREVIQRHHRRSASATPRAATSASRAPRRTPSVRN